MGIDLRSAALGLAMTLLAGPGLAHGDKHEGKRAPRSAAKAEQMAFGIAGDPKNATRTVLIDMTDEMRYFPAKLEVKLGETVRFVIVNRGATLHELVLGTMTELTAHAELMRTFPDMEHDEPHMAHVAPGKTGEIVWRFNRRGEFNYACLIAGHFEAGMLGTVLVR